MSDKKQGLKVELKGDVLTISIGIESLRFAAELSDQLQLPMSSSDDAMNAIVFDEPAFAREVVRELEREEEDGTTPVHRMLDEAFGQVLENGGIGVAAPEWSSKKEWRAALALKKGRVDGTSGYGD